MNKYIPLVTHYSFDSDVPVQLFDNQQEACAELKKQFEEELRIQIEEQEHVEGEDLGVKKSDDRTYASISIDFENTNDVIEWSIGRIVETK